MKVEVSKATGVVLDYMAAKAEGFKDYPSDSIECGKYWHTDPRKAPFGPRVEKSGYNPSTNWAIGGPILNREVHTMTERDGVYETEVFYPKYPNPYRFCHAMKGKTMLEAAMRTFVVSRLGPEVEVPDELLVAL